MRGAHASRSPASRPACAAAQWNLISFNFGLHDLGGTDGYESALTNFTARLLRTGAKLAFVSTTPFSEAARQWMGHGGAAAEGCPPLLLQCRTTTTGTRSSSSSTSSRSVRAPAAAGVDFQQTVSPPLAGVTAAAGVPYLDLYHHITAYCGANYSSWCVPPKPFSMHAPPHRRTHPPP